MFDFFQPHYHKYDHPQVAGLSIWINAWMMIFAIDVENLVILLSLSTCTTSILELEYIDLNQIWLGKIKSFIIHIHRTKLFAKRSCHKDRYSPIGLFMCAIFALRLQILLRNNRYSLKTAHARYMSIKIVNFLVLGQIVQLLGQSDLNIKPLFFLIFMFSDELEPLLIP